jgi:hypothetical protein
VVYASLQAMPSQRSHKCCAHDTKEEAQRCKAIQKAYEDIGMAFM